MNFKDLEYFVEVFDKKSFSQAAVKKGVSQPTVTLAIKRLENEFNARLFIRNHTHQRLEPTIEGEQLVTHARDVLSELDLAKKELKQIATDKIRLGLPPIIGNYYFPHISPSLFRSGLLNNIESVEAGSADLRKRLVNGDIDVALLGSLAPIKDDALVVRQFEISSFKIIVSLKSPLAKKQAFAFASLKDENFIVLDQGFVHQRAFKELSHAAHFRPKIIYPTQDIHILKALVAQNIGIGFLTESAIDTSDQIHPLDLLDDEQPSFFMSIVYRKSKILTAKEKKLVALLQRELAP